MANKGARKKKVSRSRTEEVTVKDKTKTKRSHGGSFDTEPAMVTVRLGNTYNTGNYESARIDVGLTLPCEPKDSHIEKAYAYAREWVEKKLVTESKRIGGAL